MHRRREIEDLDGFWTRQYAYYLREHRHPVNRALHLIGIPIVILSLLWGLRSRNWKVLAGGQAVGWSLQILGHGFEGNRPAFFDRSLSLLVGPIFVTVEALEMLGLRFAFAEEARSVVLAADPADSPTRERAGPGGTRPVEAER